MRAIRLLGVWMWAMFSLVAGCSSEGEVGEECGESGVEAGECVEGAICGKHDSSGTLTCLKVCDAQTDCAANEDCNGVDGSSAKGCRLKP